MLGERSQNLLRERSVDDQCKLLAALCSFDSFLKDNLQSGQLVAAAQALLTSADTICTLGEKLSGKLRQIRRKFADVITKEELIRIVSDEARGFGWRARDESWATAVERHINHIHKSRFAKVVQLCKKLSCHVVGVPYEFRGAENLEVKNLSRPTLVPVLMHSCGMMGKSVLGIVQKTEIGNMVGEVDDGEEVLDAKGSAQELVHPYKAIINTDITVKDAEKEGSHIGLAHNVTKIRRLVNRREELFANLIRR
jgi:hypothetical protein